RDEHGRRQVEPDDYRRNLAEIVARLRRTGAALVWATTTPVPAGVQGPRRDPADVARYNQVARGVMEAAGVRIHDLGGFAQARAQRLQIPRNVHFTPAGSAALARPVAREIRRALRHRNHQKRGSRHPPGGRPGGVGRAGSRPANASAGECGAAGAAGNPAG
ncbi:MAG: SGNH/GDSL hydrolase family protein, partial [Verrucomicrobiota bacterium]